MSIATTASATSAPTEFLRVKDESYAYRRIGGGGMVAQQMALDRPSSIHRMILLQKIFFAPTASSQAAGGAFVDRLAQRTEDLDTPSGPFTRQLSAFLASDSPVAPY